MSTDEANRDNIMKDKERLQSEGDDDVHLIAGRKKTSSVGHTRSLRFLKMVGFDVSISSTGLARAPGRLSSAALIYGEGGNMQNQPVRARSMYVADPGCVLLYFDSSQAEARVVAYRANIPKWKAAV